MPIARVRKPTSENERWRVAKKISPHQRGAVKLSRAYGVDLLCVRYRENPDGTERLTTVELIVERAIIQKRHDPLVHVKIWHDELDLRRQLKASGARYDARTYVWELLRSEALRLGLRKRIVNTKP